MNPIEKPDNNIYILNTGKKKKVLNVFKCENNIYS
jgi:hypothetical protein